MLPHCLVDDSDSDCNLFTISARSPSFRIDRMVTLLCVSGRELNA
jgi:hypothetical protein